MPSPLDAGLLADAIVGIDEALLSAEIQASPSRKARAVANLYLAFCKASPAERVMIKSAAALQVSEWIPE